MSNFWKKNKRKNGQDSTPKEYTHFVTVQEVHKKDIQKTYDTNKSIVWTEYKE